MSLERLEQDANGDLIYRFNRPCSDGTTGIKLAPLELLEKLSALVPLPRAHLVRYGGCLAPNSKLRARSFPHLANRVRMGMRSKTGTPYWNWARLFGRVFDLDMATLPILPPWLPAHRRRGHLFRPCVRIIAPSPGVSDDPYFAPSQIGLRSTSHCPGPPVPGDICFRRSPRQRRSISDVRAAAVSFASLPLEIPFEIAPPQLCHTGPLPRPWHPETPETPCYAILSRLYRLRISLPRLAATPLRRAAAGCWGSRQHCERAAAAGEGGPEASGGSGGAKMPLVFPIRKLYSEENGATLKKLGFITRIPGTLKLVTQVIGQALARDTWHDLDETTRYQPIELYHYGMAQRWLVVCSQASYDRAEASVNNALKREADAIQKQLFHLQAKRFETPREAQEALSVLGKKWRYHQVDTDELIEHKRYGKKGRSHSCNLDQRHSVADSRPGEAR